MLPLDKDLRERKNSIQEFEEITVRVLEYLPNVLSEFKEKIVNSKKKVDIKFILHLLQERQSILDQ